VRYPHGDGGPDRRKGELYDLKKDPGELHNLIDDPEHASLVKRLRAELDRLIKSTGGRSWEQMPIDQGIKEQLPDEEIR
jgi:N-acetylglucosamine-6-sulfatase